MADGMSAPRPEYTAAGNGRRLKMWRVPMSGPNSASNIGTVLARTRDSVRNNPWIGTAIERSVSNGIGVGIQCRQRWGTKEFRKQTNNLWKWWMKVADADGVCNHFAQQALAWREWREAGEVLGRLRSRRAEDGLPVPLQVQLIESEQCPRDYYAMARNGNAIRQGVEFNKFGKRVAYWMYRTHPGDSNWMEANGQELVRVPADQVIHLFRQLRAGQIRGVPDLAGVVVRAFNLDTLDDNVLERRKIANLFAGFYKRDVGASDESVLEETSPGDDTDDTPLAGLEPGTMQELPAGVEPVFANPPGAGDDYAEFLRGHLMAICARAGIPYEIVTGDLRDVSDRALKLILNEFRRLIEMDQWLYAIPQFCARIREAWFDAAILAGKLVVDGYADIRDEVVDALYVTQGWPYSHPVQDVDAIGKAIRGGLTSRNKEVLGQGEDPEEIDAEQVADNARADAMGLKYDTDGRQPKNGTNPQAPSDPGGNNEDKK